MPLTILSLALIYQVSAAQEPITPFLKRVRSLYEDKGVSTILVCGGSGDYFDVADTVLNTTNNGMNFFFLSEHIFSCNFNSILYFLFLIHVPQVVGLDCYAAADRTNDAKAIAKSFATSFLPSSSSSSSAASGSTATSNGNDAPFNRLPWRCPAPATLTCGSGAKVTARGAGRLQYGEREIELGLVEQLVEESQVRAIGDSLKLLATTAASTGALPPAPPPSNASAGGTPPPPPAGSVAALLAHWKQSLDARGLDALNPGFYHGAYARPRAVEVAAAMNRLRGADFRHVAATSSSPLSPRQQQRPMEQGN